MEYTLGLEKSANADLIKKIDYSEQALREAQEKIDRLEDRMNEAEEKNKRLERHTTKPEKDYLRAYSLMKHLRKALDDEKERGRNQAKASTKVCPLRGFNTWRRVDILARSGSEGFGLGQSSKGATSKCQEPACYRKSSSSQDSRMGIQRNTQATVQALTSNEEG